MDSIAEWLNIIIGFASIVLTYFAWRRPVSAQSGDQVDSNQSGPTTEDKIRLVSPYSATSAILSAVFTPVVYVFVLILLDSGFSSIADEPINLTSSFFNTIPGASWLNSSSGNAIVLSLILLGIPAALGAALGLIFDNDQVDPVVPIVFAGLGGLVAGYSLYYLMTRITTPSFSVMHYAGIGIAGLATSLVVRDFLVWFVEL